MILFLDLQWEEDSGIEQGQFPRFAMALALSHLVSPLCSSSFIIETNTTVQGTTAWGKGGPSSQREKAGSELCTSVRNPGQAAVVLAVLFMLDICGCSQVHI